MIPELNPSVEAPGLPQAMVEHALEERYQGGWLCPTKADRMRLTEMSPAVRRARLLAGLFGGIGVALMGPWIGYWPLALFAAVPLPLIALDRLLVRVKRPERPVAASLAFHTTIILIAIGITGGVHSALLPWVAIPVVTAAARFRLPVFLAGALMATAGLLLACILADGNAASHDPAPLVGIVVLLGALVVVQQPILAAELRWRNDAVLDPLTGLLNRQGLPRRFLEVAEQARLTGRPVSLALIDLDGFKHLNDRFGHARGDAALKEVAYALRKELRSFELLYRIGGDELLMILPGADLASAQQVAEQARRAIGSSQQSTEHEITASIGVVSAIGDGIAFQPMYEMADQALYTAKREGRNRIAYVPDDGLRPVVDQGSTKPLRIA